MVYSGNSKKNISNFELQILNKRLEYLNRHIDILNVLWKAGIINQLDILQTQSTVNKVKEDVLQKEIEGDQTKYALARLMGFDFDSGFTLTQNISSETTPEVTFDGQETYLQNHFPGLFDIHFDARLIQFFNSSANILTNGSTSTELG